MKNKKIILLSYLILMFFFNIAVSSEKIDYSSNTIKILENGKFISGEGDVQIVIDNNIFISSEKFEYNKETGLYKIFNNVLFRDTLNNIEASGSEFIFSTFDNKILSLSVLTTTSFKKYLFCRSSINFISLPKNFFVFKSNRNS